MRILVHEFVTGGGLASQDVPASLAREGSAMLTALVADLAAIHSHQIVTTADARFPLEVPPGVEVVTLTPEADARDAQLDTLIASANAVWLVAPETDGCLERLATRVQHQGARLLGPLPATIRRVSDKAGLAHLLGRHGVACPTTRVLGPAADWGEWKTSAREIGYPVVVKPRRGAGCDGVCLVRDGRELERGVETARRVEGSESLLLQRYVPGVAASVSLLANGHRAVALTVNSQSVQASRSFFYDGGTTPFDHPLATRAVEVAIRTCEALGGLRGWVGVDLVLTDREAVVIEVNPRLTTAYLGVRSALEGNVAALALAACAGDLPPSVTVKQRVCFTSSGRIISTALDPHYLPRRGLALPQR
jgi:predicted ATP-grasp superfamily ATP-dependent carboligase